MIFLPACNFINFAKYEKKIVIMKFPYLYPGKHLGVLLFIVQALLYKEMIEIPKMFIMFDSVSF